MVKSNVPAILFGVLSMLLMSRNGLATVPYYNKYIVPILSPNYTVLSLNDVVRNMFSINSITSHRLTKFVFKDGKLPPLEVAVGDSSIFLHCNTNSISAGSVSLQYFCVDQKTWEIKTTAKYKPMVDREEKIDLSFEAVSTKGVSKNYIVKITIQKKCAAQKNVYEELNQCKPALKSLQMSNNGEFLLPATDQNMSLRIDSVTLNKFINFQGNLEIFDNSNNLIVNHSVRVGSAAEAFILETTVKKKSTSFLVKLFDEKENSYIKLTDGIIINYFRMKEFCGNRGCMENFNYWSWIVSNIPTREKSCVSDENRLENLYNSCYSAFTPVIEHSAGPYKFRERLNMKCKFDTLLPFKVTWYKVRNHVQQIVGTDNVNYNILSLSFEDIGSYRCSVTTVSNKRTQTSTLFTVNLENVFTGELHANLKNEIYDAAYKDIKSSEYTNKANYLEKEIASLLDNGVVPNGATFNIQSFSNESNFLGIKGVLSAYKTSPSLFNMKWVLRTIKIMKVSHLSFAADSVKLLTRETCGSETDKGSDSVHAYVWPATNNGETAYLPCPGNNHKNISKKCLRELESSYAVWQPLDDSECVYSTNPLTSTLEALARVPLSPDNVVRISSELKETSSTGSVNYTPYDAHLLVTSINRFLNYLKTDAEVEENIMSTVDIFLGIDRYVLAESEEKNQSTSRIMNFIGDAGEKLAENVPHTVNRKKFALGGMKIKRTNFNSLTIDARHVGTTNILDFHSNGESLENKSRDAIILLPHSITSALPASVQDLTVVAVTYENDNVFQVDRNTQSAFSGWNVNTHIISAEIRGQRINNLEKPIVITLQSSKKRLPGYEKSCVYWNVTKRVWTDKGCKLNHSNDVDSTYTCTCNHLTNFALLFNANPPKDVHRDVLTVITYIGLTLSLLGALITFMTYAIFPMLRSSTPPKILMNLCASLILMIITFFAGLERNSSETNCKVIAGFIQYFFLTVFSWSAVEGFHSARGLVYPMKVEVTLFIQKAFAVGWGVPIIFTAIGASVWNSDYGREESCVVTGKAFFVTVLVPIAAVLLFNLIALIAIFMSLKSSSQKYSTNSLSVKDRFRIIVAFMVLFGITWAFGVLVIVSDTVIFQYLFCILSGLQGLYIFLFYCVRNRKIRKFWYGLVRGRNIREMQRESTRKTQKPRAGTVDSYAYNSTSESKEYRLSNFRT